MLIDSHCHLNHLHVDDLPNGLDTLLDDARERGVSRFLSVAVNLDSAKALVSLAKNYDDIDVSVGVHPLQEQLPPLPTVEELVTLSTEPSVVAIGETGLDNHYGADSADWQEESFKRHLLAAKSANKPLIIHTREAQQQTIALLKAHGATTPNPGVIHCFTESWDMAQAVLELGYYLSFSGIITFKNAASLREVVSKVPLERILVETDAPWLAPIPYRGKQNQPQYVVEVAECVAEVKGISFQEVAEVTTENYHRLFGQ